MERAMAAQPPQDEETANGPATRAVGDNPAGKVRFVQGAAVWEWNTRTGAFDLESTTMLLRRLDNPELSLINTPVGQRDLQLSGEIARQQQTPPSAVPASEPSASASPPDASDWALQTYVPPGHTLRPAGDQAAGQGTAWALESGSDLMRKRLPNKRQGYNPYGDDEPTPRSRKG